MDFEDILIEDLVDYIDNPLSKNNIVYTKDKCSNIAS